MLFLDDTISQGRVYFSVLVDATWCYTVHGQTIQQAVYICCISIYDLSTFLLSFLLDLVMDSPVVNIMDYSSIFSAFAMEEWPVDFNCTKSTFWSKKISSRTATTKSYINCSERAARFLSFFVLLCLLSTVTGFLWGVVLYKLTDEDYY